MKKGIVLSLFLFSLLVSPVFAQDDASDAAMMNPEPTPVPEVSYDLPYPGLLPDNPLYSLKVLRDNIVGFLISSPIKKSEFDLLQADKRLQAGRFLIAKDKNKFSLAEQTISKGENYFDQAIGAAQDAKKQGLLTTGWANKLATAARKHKEVLDQLETEVSSSQQKQLDALEQRVVGFEKKADSLSSK